MKKFLIGTIVIVVILTLGFGFGATAFAGSRGDFWADFGQMVGALSNKRHEQSEKNAHIGRFAGRVVGSSMENRHGYYYNDTWHNRNQRIVVIQPPRHYISPPAVIYEQAPPVVIHRQDCWDCDNSYRDDYNYNYYDSNRGKQEQQYYYDEQNNDGAYFVPANATLQKVFRGKTVQVEIYNVRAKALAEEMIRVNGGKVYYGHDAALIIKAETTYNSYDNNHQRITVVARVVCGPNKALVLSGSWSVVYSNYYSGKQQEYEFRAFAKALQNLH